MIDLNADVGESFGIYEIGNDFQLLAYVSSANIACGFHAGDPNVMTRTVKASLENGVAIGAHPGYPDLQGFGRRSMNFSPEELYNMILYQSGALQAIVKAYGGKLQHVKPHGALYNEAVVHLQKATAIAQATMALGADVILMGPAGSALQKAAESCEIPFAREVFADRAYEDNGQLVSRSKAGALIHDEAVCIRRMVDMLEKKPILSINGTPLTLSGDTICLHGDHPESVSFAAALNKSIQAAGHSIESLSQWIL
ncbi:MAG: 5-oxoprolinase subunit PxpA [Bacillota bacterium]|nr:5-oxoprolinase subunit PxpA [Bacillota bacterium]MDW7677575.1 5-oxoprolinase subunit PxpA [Bacillota bacterium]